MNTGRCLTVGLLTLAFLAVPLVGFADTFKREGGKAFHSRSTCPALRDFKVIKVESTAGLVPCRVCCKDLVIEEQRKFSGMKLNQPRALTIQEMAGTNKAKEAAEPAPDEHRRYGGGRVFYPIRRVFYPIHYVYGGEYVVSNGQVLDAFSGQAVNADYGGDMGGFFGGE